MEEGYSLNMSLEFNRGAGILVELEPYYTIIMDVLMVLAIFALVLVFLYLIYGKEKGSK